MDFQNIYTDLRRRANILRLIRHRVPTKLLRTFVQALLIGKLGHITPLLSAEEPTGTLGPLHKGIRLFARLVSGAVRSTPARLLHAYTKIPVLQDLVGYACRSTVIRAAPNPRSQLAIDLEEWRNRGAPGRNRSPFGGLLDALEEIEDSFSPGYISGKTRPSSEHIRALSKLELRIARDRDEARSLLRQGKLIRAHDLAIFTDGSLDSFNYIPKRAAAGWITINSSEDILDQGRQRIIPAISSYQAELVAIYLALESAEKQNLLEGRSSIAIYSDSRSVLTAIESIGSKGKLVDAETETLLDAIKTVQARGPDSFEAVWIPVLPSSMSIATVHIISTYQAISLISYLLSFLT